MEYVLGIDVGTSACKAALVDATGGSTSAASETYAFDAPRPEWAEQDPDLWWRGVVEAVSRVCTSAGAEDVAAVGLTGQMHSAVLLDAHLDVVRPPLLWCDQRPKAEAEEANTTFPRIVDITLNPLLPAFTLAKLLWSRAHEPDLFARVQHVILPKDLMRLRFTGSLATDPSDAAGNGDVRRPCLAMVRGGPVPLRDLVRLVAGRHGLERRRGRPRGGCGAYARAASGNAGRDRGGDQAAQAVGLGAVDERILAAQIGTSGVLVAAVSAPAMGAFCHALPDRWIRLDSLHAAGSSIVWICDAVARGEEIAELLGAAGDVAAGADGLLFLPFLMGERAGFLSSAPAAFGRTRAAQDLGRHAGDRS